MRIFPPLVFFTLGKREDRRLTFSCWVGSCAHFPRTLLSESYCTGAVREPLPSQIAPQGSQEKQATRDKSKKKGLALSTCFGRRWLEQPTTWVGLLWLDCPIWATCFQNHEWHLSTCQNKIFLSFFLRTFTFNPFTKQNQHLMNPYSIFSPFPGRVLVEDLPWNGCSQGSSEAGVFREGWGHLLHQKPLDFRRLCLGF